MAAALYRRLTARRSDELAAARLRTRRASRTVDELGSALSGLRTDAVDVPDRQQSLHDTVGWTVRQLRADERSLLGVLSAFVGGASIPSLRDVLDRGGLAVTDLTGSVSVLADAHIVAPVDRAGQVRLTCSTRSEVGADSRGRHGPGGPRRRFPDLMRRGAANGNGEQDKRPGRWTGRSTANRL